MRRRLFWKIWLGFWAAYLLLMTATWIFWTLQPTKAWLEWDPPHASGTALVDGAARALQRGGPHQFQRHVADWSTAARQRLTIAPIDRDRCTSALNSRDITRRVAGPARAWCLRYRTPPLPGETSWSDLFTPPDWLIAVGVAGVVFSGALALYLTRPIKMLRGGFEQLARGNLQVRLSGRMGRRRDEIADLAQDFDAMAERLQELVDARDRLLHDVSHELRSPLARMRLAADLLRRDPARGQASLDRIDREADHLDALVGELLTLARLESEAGDGEDYFDLLEIVKLVIEDATFEAQAQQIALHADLPPDSSENTWLVLGSGQLVHRAIENIVRNALRFSSAGQTVTLALRQDGSDACIVTVEDEGPGIEDGEASQLLEPFVQGARQYGKGFGLGLGIARRAIATCKGSVTLENRRPAGLCVTVSLPLASTALIAGNPRPLTNPEERY